MTFIPEFEDALVSLPSVITLEALLPGGVESLDNAIYRALRHDNIDEAVEEAEANWQDDGAEDLEATLTYGVLLVGVDVFDEASTVFEAGRKAHPNRVEPVLAEADLELERGEDEAAEALLDMFGDLADDTVDGPVWGYAGDLLLDVGRDDEAVEAYEEALDRGSEDFETVIRLAELHRRRGDSRRAAECFEIAADLRGRAIGPWEQAAECWEEAGNMRRSLKAREHVLKARESDAESWARQGLGLRSVGELGDAIEALEKATRLDPRDPAYWIELAHTLRRAGRLEQSMSAYREVLDAEPQYVEALVGLASASLEQGDVELAEKTAREAVELDDDSAAGWWVLGRAHLARHREDDAIVALEEATSREPEDSRYLQTLGQAYMSAGRRDEALAAFEDAVEMGPDDASVAIPYAQALVRQKAWEALGELVDSPADWRQAPEWQVVEPLLRLFVEVFSDDDTPDPAGRLEAFGSALDTHRAVVPLEHDLEELRRFAMVMDGRAQWAAETMIDGLEGSDVSGELDF